MYQILRVLDWFRFNKYLLILGITYLLLLSSFVIPNKVLGVNITFESYPASISEEIFNVGVKITGANSGTNYLRIDLYKDGTNNYFGETYNGSDWYSGSSGLSYYPVSIQNASGSAIVQAQIGNPNSNDYTGSGLYKLRIRRYTSSGSLSSNDTQTPVDIQINYQTPSPTPTATPTQTSQPSPVPTQTSTPFPTKIPTPTPSVTSQPKKIETNPPIPSEESKVEITSNSIEEYNNSTSDDVVNKDIVPSVAGISTSSTIPKIAILFIVLGVLFLVFGGISLYKRMKTEYNDRSEKNL